MYFAPDGSKNVNCAIHPHEGLDHKNYGLLVCDRVRHVAEAFHVAEGDVWEWVDKERYRYTTGIRRPS
jgi:hypothetical protein